MILKIHATPKQKQFYHAEEDEVLFGGAAGGGKTRAIVTDALLKTYHHPKTTAVIFRRTYGELEDTILQEALALYPKRGVTYNVSKHEFRLFNGSRILLRHCARKQDRYLYKGLEIQWLYIDELTSFDAETYEFLKTRLRAKASMNVRPLVRCASNPGDIGHSWVKKYFVDARPEAKDGELTRLYIPSLVTDNPYIDKDYIRQLENKPEALRRAYLYGDWDAFEGQVFTEWQDDPAHYGDGLGSHVINPFPIPTSWRRFMSFDHGFTRPFSVGWWAVSPDGTAYRYREWYGCVRDQPNTGLKLTPREIADGILKREEEETRENLPIIRVADPAIFDESRGESVARQMEPTLGRPGVYFRKGENARIAGKMQLHSRLRMDDNGRAGLYVFSTCRDFIRTIPSLPYADDNPEDVDTDAEDHAYDETRYFCMLNPLPLPELPGRTEKAPTPFDEREAGYCFT